MTPKPGTGALLKNAAEHLASQYSAAFARLALRRYRPLIIGITGSVGKTTTKEIVAGVLTHAAVQPHLGLVGKSPGNMNARKGFAHAVLGYSALPKSPRVWFVRLATMPARTLRLLVAGPYPRILVLEYALGQTSSVRTLVGLARPDIAVVTAVGPAHLERWGTVERVAEDKSALVAAVPADGLVLLGADNRLAAGMAPLSHAPVQLVRGRGRDFAREVARRLCAHLGVPDDAVETALAAEVTVRRRQAVLDRGAVRIMDDSYNANPLSMEYGLETFADTARAGERRVAILGDMAELGSSSARYHEEIGTAARSRAELLIGVGAAARAYRPDHWFATSAECAAAVPRLVQAGDYVFVKGSASVGLKAVVRALTRQWPAVEAPAPSGSGS